MIFYPHGIEKSALTLTKKEMSHQSQTGVLRCPLPFVWDCLPLHYTVLAQNGLLIWINKRNLMTFLFISTAFYSFNIYLSIWLPRVLVVVRGIWVSNQGLSPGPQDWELGVRATGQPGKLQLILLLSKVTKYLWLVTLAFHSRKLHELSLVEKWVNFENTDYINIQGIWRQSLDNV